MQSKKAQLSIEFSFIAGILLASFVIFMLIVQENLSEETRDRKMMEMKEVANIVKNEIDLAHSSIEGYRREFKLPSQVYGSDYDVRINESIVFVIIPGEKYQLSMAIQDVTGDLNKTLNVITKENGTVKLN